MLPMMTQIPYLFHHKEQIMQYITIFILIFVIIVIFSTNIINYKSIWHNLVFYSQKIRNYIGKSFAIESFIATYQSCPENDEPSFSTISQILDNNYQHYPQFPLWIPERMLSYRNDSPTQIHINIDNNLHDNYSSRPRRSRTATDRYRTDTPTQ